MAKLVRVLVTMLFFSESPGLLTLASIIAVIKLSAHTKTPAVFFYHRAALVQTHQML